MAVQTDTNSPFEVSRQEFEHESLTVEGFIAALQKIKDQKSRVNISVEGWSQPLTLVREMNNQYVILE